MTTENINIVLTNATCCISKQAVKVSNLLSTGNKCAEAEAIKLKLLNDYVEILRCYNNDIITSKFKIRMLYSDFQSILEALSNPARTYELVVNHTSYTQTGDGVLTRYEVLESLTLSAPNIISIYTILDPIKPTPRYITINIEADCDVSYIDFGNNTSPHTFVFTLVTPGNCKVVNCISEEDIEIIINKIMTMCDICYCQLTQ